MNILVNIKRNYVPHLKAMLHSLFLNNPESEANVYVMHSQLTDGDIAALTRVAGQYGGGLFPIKLTGEYDAAFDVSNHFPPEAFYRMLCATYLPEDVSRVLYLDADIIVNGSLEELYTMDMKGKMFAATRDTLDFYPDFLFHKYELGMPHNAMYANGGVILMDAGKMRERVTPDMLIEKIGEIRPYLHYPDQDVFNALFCEDITFVDYHRYNNRFVTERGLLSEIKPGCHVIIHFAGPVKPWSPHYQKEIKVMAEGQALYKKYAAL